MPPAEEPTASARIEGLLKALLKIHMAPVLEAELNDEFSRKLFSLTGKVTRREIQKRLRCGPNRICETWARWDRLGILAKDGASYRKVI